MHATDHAVLPEHRQNDPVAHNWHASPPATQTNRHRGTRLVGGWHARRLRSCRRCYRYLYRRGRAFSLARQLRAKNTKDTRTTGPWLFLPLYIQRICLDSLHAAIDGQANVVHGNSLFLTDDSNSCWWLVRVLKTREVGYIRRNRDTV